MRFDPTAKSLSYAAWSGAGGAFFLGRPVVAGCILGAHAVLCVVSWAMGR
jgi:hypothetical protein